MTNPLWDLLAVPAMVAPERPILTCAGRTVTLGELAAAARRTAAALGPGPVALLDVNSDHYLRLLYAVWAADGSAHLLNYRLRAPEVRSILDLAGTRGLVTGARYADLARAATPGTGVSWTATLPDPTTPATGAAVDPDRPGLTLFTSGTTALPKPVVFDPAALAGYVMTTSTLCDPATADEAMLLGMPLYHVAGLVGVLRSVFTGRRVVVQEQFDVDGWLELVATERITHAFVVPTMLDRITEALATRSADLSSLRVLTYGGGPMPRTVITRALRALPAVEFVSTYGMTEAGGTVTVLDGPDHAAARAGDPAAVARLTSVGRPLPDVRIHIGAPDGSPLPAGAPGEVFVAGPRAPLATPHPTLGDRWLRTGDLGHLDPDGYLYLGGRADDVIVRGGENIVPAEIEEALRQHPAVRDCAVLGVPDPHWGQRVIAVVVGRAPVTADALRTHLRGHLATFKIPETFHTLAALPTNPTGKVLRSALTADPGPELP